MYEPGYYRSNLAFFWPAFVAASASEMAALVARQFTNLAVGCDRPAATPPQWTTPNKVAVALETVQLRDFTIATEGFPTLLCTPIALHGAAVADLAAGHSLVAALREAGLTRLFATDWHSATADMRFLGIDDYLADLNVLVDEIGAPVDLIGLCQGGWMALVYAARFPGKVRKLVLAAAPIDIAAAASPLSTFAAASPLAMFRKLVELGDGLIAGHNVLKFWGPETVASENIRELLQTDEAQGSAAFGNLEVLFRTWHSWTLNLPGRYFLEVVDRLYKRNALAGGGFVALGRQIDLATLRVPIFLLAARDDELVAPPQLFAVEHLVGTNRRAIAKTTASCRHIGLFVGKRVLADVWPGVVHWLADAALLDPERSPIVEPAA